MSANVPVHTPLAMSSASQSLDVGRMDHLHEPLQRGKLDPLHPLPQPRHFLLNPRLRLLDLQLLHIRLLPDPSLLQVQIQPHTRLRPSNLVSQAGIQLGKIISKAFMRGPCELGLGRVGREEFGAELRKVHFLRVGRALRIWSSQILRPKTLGGVNKAGDR